MCTADVTYLDAPYASAKTASNRRESSNNPKIFAGKARKPVRSRHIRQFLSIFHYFLFIFAAALASGAIFNTIYLFSS